MGNDDEIDYEEKRQELNHAALDYLICVGLMSSVMHKFPSDVQENFVEKVETIGILLREEAEEITRFGDALDDHLPGTSDND